MKHINTYQLFEGKKTYIKPLTDEKLVECLKTTHSNWLSGKKIIWRGVTSQYYHAGNITNQYTDIDLVDPKVIRRISPWTSCNVYNLLLSNLPEWKKTPRDKGLVFDVNIQDHGDNHRIVIPKNESTLILTNASDLWYAFDLPDGMNLGRFNDIFLELKEYNNITRKLFDDKDYSKFKEFCEYLDKIGPAKLSRKLDNSVKKQYDLLFGICHDHLERCEVILDPSNANSYHGIEKIKYGENFDIKSVSCEGWTNEPCILATPRYLRDLLDKNKLGFSYDRNELIDRYE